MSVKLRLCKEANNAQFLFNGSVSGCWNRNLDFWPDPFKVIIIPRPRPSLSTFFQTLIHHHPLASLFQPCRIPQCILPSCTFCSFLFSFFLHSTSHTNILCSDRSDERLCVFLSFPFIFASLVWFGLPLHFSAAPPRTKRKRDLSGSLETRARVKRS